MGAVINITESDVVPADFSLAKLVADKLDRHYPGDDGLGHGWCVWVSHKQGVAIVRNLRLAQKFPQLRALCYVMPLVDLFTDRSLKEVVRAGGAILEAFNVERGRYTDARYEHADPAAGAGEFAAKPVPDP